MKLFGVSYVWVLYKYHHENCTTCKIVPLLKFVHYINLYKHCREICIRYKLVQTFGNVCRKQRDCTMYIHYQGYCERCKSVQPLPQNCTRRKLVQRLPWDLYKMQTHENVTTDITLPIWSHLYSYNISLIHQLQSLESDIRKIGRVNPCKNALRLLTAPLLWRDLIASGRCGWANKAI